MKVSPKVGTAISLIGFVASIFVTSLATIRATKKVTETKIEKGELTKKEIFKSCYKEYITPAILIVSTSAAIIGTRILDDKKEAELCASLYALKKSYDKYGAAVKNVFGIEAAKQIDKECAKISEKDIVTSNKNKDIYWLGYGFDTYFYSTEEDIEQASYKLNRKLRTQNVASLSDFLEYLGEKPNHLTSMYGWGRHELYTELEDGWLDIDYEIVDGDNDEIIRVITFNSIPNDTYEDTDKWYGVGGPLDRSVPFNLDPSEEELNIYKKEI